MQAYWYGPIMPGTLGSAVPKPMKMKTTTAALNGSCEVEGADHDVARQDGQEPQRQRDQEDGQQQAAGWAAPACRRRSRR